MEKAENKGIQIIKLADRLQELSTKVRFRKILLKDLDFALKKKCALDNEVKKIPKIIKNETQEIGNYL